MEHTEREFQSIYNLRVLSHTAALFTDEDSTKLIAKDGRVYVMAPFLDDDDDLVLHELEFHTC